MNKVRDNFLLMLRDNGIVSKTIPSIVHFDGDKFWEIEKVVYIGEYWSSIKKHNIFERKR